MIWSKANLENLFFAPEYRLLKDREFLILSPIDFTASNDKYYIQRSFP
jgi:hypothetical protein